MATTGASLPIERSYLIRAWLAVAAIVIVSITIVAIALAVSRGTPAGGTDPTPVGGGPAQTRHEPIVVNGNVCGQCR